MIKKITLITVLLFVGLVIADFVNNQALTNTIGANAGNTGSPGDGGITCVSCHGGTATSQTGLITSTIPTGGYLSGTTYTITATINHSTFNKFGFQVSPQNTSGALLGTMVITNTTETQLVGAGKYITHKSAGTTGTSNSKTWTFDWVAPAVGTGAVTFYGAFNAANNNGQSTGDEIFTSTLTVQQDIASSINEIKKKEGIISLFPNPVSENLSVSFKAESFASQSIVEILSIDGRMVKKMMLEDSASANSIQHFQINLTDLNAGVYFVAIKTEEGNFVEKVIKK